MYTHGLLLVASSFAVAATMAAQTPADSAIDRAVDAYSQIRTARATFEQSIKNSLTRSELKSRGEFEQARPDKFVFRFTDPKGDLVLSDGKFVWLYLPSSTPGQVIRAPLSADLEGSMDMIGTFFTNPKARYAIVDGGAAVVDGHQTRLVTLTPKSKDGSFQRAKVWIDIRDGLLRQFEATEHSGLVRAVRILTFQPNAQVSPAAFRFKTPRGVKIVDGGTLR